MTIFEKKHVWENFAEQYCAEKTIVEPHEYLVWKEHDRLISSWYNKTLVKQHQVYKDHGMTWKISLAWKYHDRQTLGEKRIWSSNRRFYRITVNRIQVWHKLWMKEYGSPLSATTKHGQPILGIRRQWPTKMRCEKTMVDQHQVPQNYCRPISAMKQTMVQELWFEAIHFKKGHQTSFGSLKAKVDQNQLWKPKVWPNSAMVNNIGYAKKMAKL